MSYFEVRYRAEGLTLKGNWMDYMNSGFISSDLQSFLWFDSDLC